MDFALHSPSAFFRNPRHLEQGWEQQRRDHAGFVAHFGTDALIVPGAGLQAALDGYTAARVAAAQERATRDGRAPPGAGEAAKMRLPDDLLAAPEVGVLYHPVWGQGFYPDFSELAAAFEDPHGALRGDGAEVVLDFLDDDEIAPLPLVILAEHHPEAASRLFSVLLEWPDFDWARDGEALLRERKPGHYARLLPRVLPLPDRLVKAFERMSALRWR